MFWMLPWAGSQWEHPPRRPLHPGRPPTSRQRDFQLLLLGKYIQLVQTMVYLTVRDSGHTTIRP